MPIHMDIKLEEKTNAPRHILTYIKDQHIQIYLNTLSDRLKDKDVHKNKERHTNIHDKRFKAE